MHQKKKLIVLTGAGMSAESGLKTFRDNDGLWENHNIYEVATPEAWASNKELVLDFYNERRAQLAEAEPNIGHHLLAEMEKNWHVQIITQNVDNLHERANSTNILHLHGELTKVRCTMDEKEIIDIGYKKLKKDDISSQGYPLRPHIVWFGEAVPKIEEATTIVQEADVVLIIGTSMQVYPAAGLLEYASNQCQIFCINPDTELELNSKVKIIQKKAVEGIQYFLNNYADNLG